MSSHPPQQWASKDESKGPDCRPRLQRRTRCHPARASNWSGAPTRPGVPWSMLVKAWAYHMASPGSRAASSVAKICKAYFRRARGPSCSQPPHFRTLAWLRFLKSSRPLPVQPTEARARWFPPLPLGAATKDECHIAILPSGPTGLRRHRTIHMDLWPRVGGTKEEGAKVG